MKRNSVGKVLLVEEKYGTRVIDISSDERKAHAYLQLFKERDKDYYYDLRQVQSAIYERAKKGDAKAAESVIRMRNDHEYECVSVVELEAY